MTDDGEATQTTPSGPAGALSALRLLPLVLPGIVVGVGSALLLILATGIANGLEDVLWSRLPAAVGMDPNAPLWIIGILTLTGLAVGLVVVFVPGHAGPEPATVDLAGPPLPLAVLPSLAIALILALAGGVSLGPENPILGINAFQRLRSPLVMLVVGGFLLGILGVIGGPISLFKGLDQMKTLTATVADYTPASLALVAGIKLLAVVIAATSGFRGGRIFPSVFAGVAIGLFANALVPQIPEAIAVSASVVGILVAVTRSGWLAIFMGGLMVNDPAIIPILAIIVLPAWLIVTGRPEMVIRRPKAEVATA